MFMGKSLVRLGSWHVHAFSTIGSIGFGISENLRFCGSIQGYSLLLNEECCCHVFRWAVFGCSSEKELYCRNNCLFSSKNHQFSLNFDYDDSLDLFFFEFDFCDQMIAWVYQHLLKSFFDVFF